MEIQTYINDVLNLGLHADSFPAHLDIPKAFVDYCYTLYTTGERLTIELGTGLSCAPDGTLQFAGPIIDGIEGGTGINLPVTAGAANMGDLHCHPSSSIGHKNGFAAHSPEDVLSMAHHIAKPLFLRFVCSGTMIYLMAYRAGYSVITPAVIYEVRDVNHDISTAFFDSRCPMDGVQREAVMVGQPDQRAANHQMRNIRRSTPGLGEEMERLSVNGCSHISRHCDLGFYSADQGYGISVKLYGYLRMYLQ